MKKITFLIAMTLSAIAANAQTAEWLWAKTTTNESSSIGVAVTTGPDGGVYTGGSFVATALTYQGQTLSNTASNTNMFLVKHDSNGNFQWLRGVSGSSLFSEIAAIVTDDQGYVYVAGRYNGTLQLDNSSLISDGFNCFLAKYDSDGNFLWLRDLGYTQYSFVNDMKLIGDSLYITGSYQGDFIIFPSATVNSNGGSDVFVVKYDLEGNNTWVQAIGGTGNELSAGIAADSNGNIYVSGDFTSPSITFGNTITNQGQNDAFLAKFAPNGAYQWIKSSGGSSYNFGGALVIDAQDNIYTTGSYMGTYTIGGDSYTTTGTDFQVIKYDTAGTVQWHTRGTGNTGNYLTDLALDNQGNIALTGFSYSDNLTIGGSQTDLSGVSSLFISKLTPAGSHMFTTIAGEMDATESHSIAIDNNDDIYITGRAIDIAFGPTNLNSGHSVFTSKYRQGVLGNSDFNATQLVLYPNPAKSTLSINNENVLGQAFAITDITGRTVKSGVAETTIDVSALPSGIYALSINGISSKFIKE